MKHCTMIKVTSYNMHGSMNDFDMVLKKKRRFHNFHDNSIALQVNHEKLLVIIIMQFMLLETWSSEYFFCGPPKSGSSRVNIERGNNVHRFRRRSDVKITLSVARRFLGSYAGYCICLLRALLRVCDLSWVKSVILYFVWYFTQSAFKRMKGDNFNVTGNVSKQENHYENTPIQIYWKFYHQNLNVSDTNVSYFCSSRKHAYIILTPFNPTFI